MYSILCTELHTYIHIPLKYIHYLLYHIHITYIQEKKKKQKQKKKI